jgi:hypothetical protein
MAGEDRRLKLATCRVCRDQEHGAAGDVGILLAPDFEAGNMLARQLKRDDVLSPA